jgi:hypothetical protein
MCGTLPKFKSALTPVAIPTTDDDDCNADLGRLGNMLLAPAEERAGCTELCDLKHPREDYSIYPP